MNHPIVRLASLTLGNIKNVKIGTFYLPASSNVPNSFSAGVDTLYFLQQIMIESELDPKLADYIDSETTHAEIAAEFIISDVDIFYEVGYHV